MFTYLHSTIFPFVGDILGRISAISSIPWEDGLRLIMGLNISMQYNFTNLYTGISRYLIGPDTFVSFDILDVVGEGLYWLVRPVCAIFLPPSAPLWVAFLFLALVGLLVFYVLRFFFSFIK